MLYEIKREPRENHPGHSKACLYLGERKIAVCKDGKIQVKTTDTVPDEYLDALKAEWAKIRADEGPVG